MTRLILVSLLVMLSAGPLTVNDVQLAKTFSDDARIVNPDLPLSINEHYGNPDKFRTYVIKKPPVYA